MNQTEGFAQERIDSSGPKYRQIHNSLLEQFQNGDYSPSEPLPGVRSLASSMNVAVGTLRQALHQLENDGFIRRVPGKGTFVNSPKQRREQTKTNAFSVIVPMISEDPYPALVEGIEQAAGGRYRITVSSAKHDLSQQERLIRQAIKDNVAGVAIVPTASPTPVEHIQKMQDKQIPVVFCHRAVKEVEAPLVCFSFEEVGRLTAETFIAHGHQRIASIVSMRYETVLSLSNGIRNTLEEHGLDNTSYKVHYHGYMPKDNSNETVRQHHDAIREVLTQIMSDDNRPTAIYCGTFIEAEMIYLSAQDMGLTIPRDFSLINLGGSKPSGVLYQRFSSISRDERELGKQAGRLLCEMSSGLHPHNSNKAIEIPLKLLPGETVRPPP